ncbi:MAG TPA: alpha/beta fold hydrolase [Usitatibacteraceae bacterium]
MQPPPRKHRIAGLALVGALVSMLAYCGVAGFVYVTQESLIFHPVPLPADFRFALPDVTEVRIPVEGATLSALQLKLPNPRGVVFFLHGNSGNLQSWIGSVDFYRRVDYDLLVLDYRGFGKSSGRISSEAQLHEDVRRAWQWLAPQYAGKKKVIYGRSLGTGLATMLASEVQPDLTILVSPYLSLDAMARERYPWLPSAINRYPMHSDAWVPQVKRPLLILHGDNDSVIPLRQGRELAGLQPAAKLVIVPGAGHNDLQRFPVYLDAITDALDTL